MWYESDDSLSIELVAENILDHLEIVSVCLDINGGLYLRVFVTTTGRVGPCLW